MAKKLHIGKRTTKTGTVAAIPWKLIGGKQTRTSNMMRKGRYQKVTKKK